MGKRILSLLAALALMASLAGCGDGGGLDPIPSPSPSPTPAPVAAEFALPVTGGTLHPILSRDRINLTLVGLIWEGLFALDTTFTPHGVLCERYALSEDGLTWTFTLRPGVTFSDGTALTAADVVTSLLLAKGETSRFATRLAGVTGIREVAGAVVLTLSAPNGNLPALLDIPIVRGESEQPLGTGPYALVGASEDTALTARSGWWQKKSLPTQRIPLRLLPEADNLISSFDTGDIGLITADLTGTNAVGYSGNYEAWDYPTTAMVYLGFNASPKRPCTDAALRLALSHGLDRNTVAGALYARHATAAALPVSPVSALYDDRLAEAMGYSPQRLSDGLALAGYEKNGDGLLVKGRDVLSLDFLVNTDNSFRLSAAEYIAEELGRVGVTVNLLRLPWSDYQKALSRGEFDLYLGETVLTADFDPSPLLSPGGVLNFGKYANGEMATLLAALRASDNAGRPAAASAFYAWFAQEVPFAPICFKNESVLTQWGMVSGLTPTQQNPFFGVDQLRLNLG